MAPREETLTLPLPLRSWDRKNNPEPWNRLSPNDQYKVTSSGSMVAPPSPHLLVLAKGGPGHSVQSISLSLP